MFHRIIFLLLIVSLSCNFNRLSVPFVFIVHWTLLAGVLKNVTRIKRFIRLQIVITKPLNNKKIVIEQDYNNKFVIMLKRNSIKVHSLTARTRNENRLAVWVILEIFWTVSLKAHNWSSWILTECNLSWKIVKDCILSEVCMINSTVSSQMWCINRIKGWFTHSQIRRQEFVR